MNAFGLWLYKCYKFKAKLNERNRNRFNFDFEISIDKTLSDSDCVAYMTAHEEIKEIKNFGKKSADEVFHALKKKFNIVLPSLKQ